MKKVVGKLIAVFVVIAMLCPMIGAYAANEVVITGVKVNDETVDESKLKDTAAETDGMLQLAPDTLLELTLKLQEEAADTNGTAVGQEEVTYLSRQNAGSGADSEIHFIDQQASNGDGTVTIKFRPRTSTEPGVYEMMANALNTTAPLKKFYKSLQELKQPVIEGKEATVTEGTDATFTVADYTTVWANPVGSPTPTTQGATLKIKDGDTIPKEQYSFTPDSGTDNYILKIQTGTGKTLVKSDQAYTLVLSSDNNPAYEPIELSVTVTEKTYTLTLDPQEGVLSDGDKTVTFKASAPTETTFVTPTRTGYDFGGWFTEANGAGTQYDKLGSTNYQAIFGDSVAKTLYAKWTLQNYTITYHNIDGGITNTNPTTYNYETSTINLIDPGTKEGYTFGGWFSDENCTVGNEVTQIAQHSTGNKDIYAKWTATPYDVTSVIKSGANAPVNAGAAGAVTFTAGVTEGKSTIGTDVKFSVTAPAGYNVDSVKVNGGNALTAASGTYTYTMTAAAAEIQVAVTPIEYTINFDKGTDGQSVDPTSTKATVETVPKEVTLPTPVGKTGFNFTGWYTEVSAGDKITAGADGSLTPAKLVGICDGTSKACTLYAHWADERQVSIAYEKNAGNDVVGNWPSDTTSAPGTQITLPTAPTRAGYTFDKWKIDNVTYAAGANYTLPSTGGTSVEINATWTMNTYTFTFNADGGTVSPTSKEVTVENVASFSFPTPTKAGYNFKNWKNGSETVTAPTTKAALLDLFPTGTTLELTAEWEEKIPDITVTADPVSISTLNGTSVLTAAFDPADALDKYKTLNWSVTKADGSPLEDPSAVTLTPNTANGTCTLTAAKRVNNLTVKVTATNAISEKSGSATVAIDIAPSEYSLTDVKKAGSDAKVMVTKLQANDPAVVIVALYNDEDILIKASIKDVGSLSSRDEEVTITGAFDAAGYTKYKVFMWDGVGTMKDRCAPVSGGQTD